MNTGQRLVGLPARSGASFARAALDLYARGRPFVILPAGALPDELAGRVDTAALSQDGGWVAPAFSPRDSDAVAQVALTSGTTGRPKSILLTHANLADAVARLNAVMEADAAMAEYVAVPVTYSFGLGRLRALGAVDGRAWLPERGLDVAELRAMLEAGEVNALSAVPTQLRLLLRRPDALGGAAERLRWLEIGSQPMTADEKEAVRDLFPAARIVQHYGLTEASRTTLLRLDGASREELESVGRATGGVELCVEDGLVAVRGRHVAAGRLTDRSIVPLTNADGWLRTSDLGELRGGLLFFRGRADDVINVGGVKLDPEALEAELRCRLGADAPVAVARLPHALRGETVLVAVAGASADAPAAREAAAAALAQRNVQLGADLAVVQLDALPRTETGKVRRDELARLAADRLPPPAVDAGPSGGQAATVLDLFRETFPGQEVTAAQSFNDLGGDSLSFVDFALRYEERFGQLPDGWEAMPAERLATGAAPSAAAAFARMETGVAMRAAAIFAVVAGHLGFWNYGSTGGAVYALLLLAGVSFGRFRLPLIAARDTAAPAVLTALRVLVPSTLYLAAWQLALRRPDPLTLVGVSNFVDPYAAGGVVYWYVQLYAQCFLLIALVLLLKPVRDMLRRDAFVFCLVAFTVSLVAKLALGAAWNTDHLFNRVPHQLIWMVWGGAMLATARDRREKAAAVIPTALISLVDAGWTSSFFILAGVAFGLVLFPTVWLPRPLVWPVGRLAAASLFIYLSHFNASRLVEKLAGGHRPGLEVLAALVGGIVLERAYTAGERLLAGALKRSAAAAERARAAAS